jgi:hypothetical protein
MRNLTDLKGLSLQEYLPDKSDDMPRAVGKWLKEYGGNGPPFQSSGPIQVSDGVSIDGVSIPSMLIK